MTVSVQILWGFKSESSQIPSQSVSTVGFGAGSPRG